MHKLPPQSEITCLPILPQINFNLDRDNTYIHYAAIISQDYNRTSHTTYVACFNFIHEYNFIHEAKQISTIYAAES